jgi:hypothetical protein
MQQFCLFLQFSLLEKHFTNLPPNTTCFGLVGHLPIKKTVKTNKIVAFRRYTTQPWKIIYTYMFPPNFICISLLDLVILILPDEDINLRSYCLCTFLQFLFICLLLHPNILLNTLYSNTLNLYLSFKTTDQALYPYKTIHVWLVPKIL